MEEIKQYGVQNSQNEGNVVFYVPNWLEKISFECYNLCWM